MSRCSFGLDFMTTPPLASALHLMQHYCCDFLCINLQHPNYEAFTEDISLLTHSREWCRFVVGKVSSGVSEAQLEAELAYANHLQLPAVMLSHSSLGAPSTMSIQALARIVSSHLANNTDRKVWVPASCLGGEADPQLVYRQWVLLRSLCGNASNLVPVPMVPSSASVPLPSQWLGEDIGGVWMDAEGCSWENVDAVSTARALLKRHRTAMFPIRTTVMNDEDYAVARRVLTASLTAKHDLTRADVAMAKSATDDEIDSLHEDANDFSAYNDIPQAPLQPLGDQLTNATYEVFEHDKPKYEHYQRAIESKLKQLKAVVVTSGQPIRIAVVGAGRGPLVDRAIDAAAALGLYDNIAVTAVEKNPHSLVYLNAVLQSGKWHDKVQVIPGDLRAVLQQSGANPSPSSSFHVIISELLGSFGDNELSPECLDAVTPLLHRELGSSIPQQYTSHLAPIHNVRLHNTIRSLEFSRDRKTCMNRFDMPYVVKINAGTMLCEPQPCFTFAHTVSADLRTTNERHAQLRFVPVGSAGAVWTCHGFVGYFSSQLYGDVLLSTVPSTHTPNMQSWFPIYFPIDVPQHLVCGNDVMVVDFWRKVEEGKRVWYEWCVSSPVPSRIFNSGGKNYSIVL